MFMAIADRNDPGADLVPEDSPLSAFAAHAQDDPCRAEVEGFIRRVYARRFQAEVRHFTPTLVSLRDPASGQLVAAAGYRQASQAPLFLERYLDEPVEAVLARLTTPEQAAPDRSAIVEIGHLAGVRAGEGRRLIHLLTPWLAAQNFGWVVSTLTRELMHLFLRLGLRPHALARAQAARLGSDAAQWGSYYDHAPLVFAGDLQGALATLKTTALRTGVAR